MFINSGNLSALSRLLSSFTQQMFDNHISPVLFSSSYVPTVSFFGKRYLLSHCSGCDLCIDRVKDADKDGGCDLKISADRRTFMPSVSVCAAAGKGAKEAQSL